VTNDLPTGSWKHSSQNAKTSGYTLFADLKDKHGKWKQASVHFMPGQAFGNNDGNFILESDKFHSGGMNVS